jgi:hypothetical protein
MSVHVQVHTRYDSLKQRKLSAVDPLCDRTGTELNAVPVGVRRC